MNQREGTNRNCIPNIVGSGCSSVSRKDRSTENDATSDMAVSRCKRKRILKFGGILYCPAFGCACAKPWIGSPRHGAYGTFLVRWRCRRATICILFLGMRDVTCVVANEGVSFSLQEPQILPSFEGLAQKRSVSECSGILRHLLWRLRARGLYRSVAYARPTCVRVVCRIDRWNNIIRYRDA